MSSSPESTDDLVVRRSRENRVFPIIALGTSATSQLINLDDVDGRWRDVAFTLFVITLVLIVVQTIEVLRSGPRSAPLVRVGPAGLTLPDAETVPWSDIESVRVTRARSGTIRAVAFVPAPGRTVPAIRPFGLRTFPGGGRPGRTTARYGSALVVLPHQMTVTAAQVIHAAQVFGHLETSWPAPARAGRPTTRTGRASSPSSRSDLRSGPG